MVLAGCSYNPKNPPNGNSDAPPGDDAIVDRDANSDIDAFVQNDGPMAADCYGQFATICLPVIPNTQIQVNGGVTRTVDTDSAVDCLETAIGTTVIACVIAGTTVTIDGFLIAHGSRPLVVIALGNLTINGGPARLDVASRKGRPIGAGARTTCAGTTAAQMSGGGFGGTYQQPGGNGGTGDAGSGGIAAGARLLETLEGGCPGGDGLASAASAGPGGGAVLMIASLVTVNGTVNASGQGGDGGAPGVNGGGGGGSGGLIVADAPSFTINGSGRLMAQGGGGGEGGQVGVGGADGDDPSVGTAAVGGQGLSMLGGDGGDGGVLAAGSPGLNGAAVGGGGGGGGGVGFIVHRAATPTTNGMTFPALGKFN